MELGEIEKNIISYFLSTETGTISDLAGKTGYSIPTATKYLTLLINEGLLLCKGKTAEERGRQAAIYGIQPAYGYFIGVDIKHNELLIAAMDFSGVQLGLEREAINFENTPEMLETICLHIEAFILRSALPRENIRSININISGRVNIYRGESFSVFHFEDFSGPLTETLSARLGIKTFIENDTRAMAFAELVEGTAKGLEYALFINAGWGIGMSVVSRGKIY